MVREKIKELALRREIQVLVIFGVLTSVGYYIWLKKKKDKKEATAIFK